MLLLGSLMKYSVLIICAILLFISCDAQYSINSNDHGKEIPSHDDSKSSKKIIINPYESIDFSKASRVKAISHEHIYTKNQLKKAYDRGIRYFACVNYFPACPSYPLSKWSYEYEDYISPSNLTLTSFTYSGSIKSFVDKEGNIIDTDDLIQLPNAEHAFYAGTEGRHFNVLGSTFGECTNGTRNTGEWSEEALGMKKGSWYNLHPKWSISDINNQYLNPNNQLFPGKVFGTINHSYSEKYTRLMLDECPDVFKAIEIVNQGSSEESNEKYRALWDKFLSEGRQIWGVSAIDWQKDNRLGACNVLLINDYDDQPSIRKAELGLDAYITGAFIPAGLADNDILDLSHDDTTIHIAVSGNPTEMILVTNLGRKPYVGTNYIDYVIEDNVSFVRFEIWYKDESGKLIDYLFTNPLFIQSQ